MQMERNQQQRLKWLIRKGTGSTAGQGKKLRALLMVYCYRVKQGLATKTAKGVKHRQAFSWIVS